MDIHFTRMGMFWECIGDDVATVCKVLRLYQTRLRDGRPLVGFPVYATQAEDYFQQLSNAGHHVVRHV